MKFFAWDWVNPVSDPIGSGTWKELTEHGKTIIEVSAPSDVAQQSTWSLFDSVTGKAYLTEVDGFVRLVAPAEAHPEEEYVFEASTLPVILDSFNYPLTLGECLASLPDAGYVKKVGDKLEYVAQQDVIWNDDGKVSYVESIEYKGNTFSWLSKYQTIQNLPSWVANSQNSLNKDLFSRFSADGETLVAQEESFYSDNVFYGFQNWVPEDPESLFGRVITPISASVENGSLHLNQPVTHQQERVSLAELDFGLSFGTPYDGLAIEQFSYDQEYLGKVSVTVPAGTFDACVVTESNFVAQTAAPNAIYTYWQTNVGTIKRSVYDPMWVTTYDREATKLPAVN